MDTDKPDSDGIRLRDRLHCQVHRETANNLQRYREGKTQMRRKLKEARQKAGMTQQQMADRLGIGLRHYKKIESGETLGSVSLWDDMEDILEVNQRVLREIHPGKGDSL